LSFLKQFAKPLPREALLICGAQEMWEIGVPADHVADIGWYSPCQMHEVVEVLVQGLGNGSQCLLTWWRSFFICLNPREIRWRNAQLSSHLSQAELFLFTFLADPLS
jgi:hypothetical protein